MTNNKTHIDHMHDTEFDRESSLFVKVLFFSTNALGWITPTPHHHRERDRERE